MNRKSSELRESPRGQRSGVTGRRSMQDGPQLSTPLGG